MKVTKELLEKYHRGHCTPEEKTAVENWLLDDSDVDDSFPVFVDEATIQQEMWSHIQQELPSSKPRRLFRWSLLGSVAAACVVVLGLGWLLYRTHTPATPQSQEISGRDYTLAAGPESKVQVTKAGIINFCGRLEIQPKKDVQLSFIEQSPEHFSFQKGETYFAFYTCQKADHEKILVIKEKSLQSLPPVAKRQLMDEWGI